MSPPTLSSSIYNTTIQKPTTQQVKLKVLIVDDNLLNLVSHLHHLLTLTIADLHLLTHRES
jgi:hypothetical protein